MIEITIYFILSQVAIGLSMIMDFLSLQFKERKLIFSCLAISAGLVSAHFFLLGKFAAGTLVFISIFRLIICSFSHNKKWMYLFLFASTLVLFVTYKEPFDFLIFIALIVFIIGNFQENQNRMRFIMSSGTALALIYNIAIFSPMGMIAELNFLISGIIGIYRHSKKNKEIIDNHP